MISAPFKEYYWAEQSAIDVHSSEAYMAAPFFIKKWLVIPYINLGLKESSVNTDPSNMQYIDYCYILCNEVSVLLYNKKDLIGGGTNWQQVYGGNLLFDPMAGGEFLVRAKHYSLVTFSFSKITNTLWCPEKENKEFFNMDEAMVRRFFQNEFLPTAVLNDVIPEQTLK